ncbi:MAG TPA: hypothetical protein PL151_00615 [Phycisphaerae bacterium]|nr:hypothetical protein [Phycisphaerae bacterium]HOJ73992.1 hypothetical protein [Phycisphaerae bacterium]HOM50587.1 hypothetical protein [Phycisphaerae bacterium]HON65096.1 hypothetical protein [Phycisphaerae bacterium]HOQ86232.1 hypothetical protein [Phycisphaerae bacterium]
MIGKRLIAGSFVIALAGLTPIWADAPTTRPAASVSDDPNWIGPKSWLRRFTIPPFVSTPRGMDVKVATTRPASETNGVPRFITRRRTNTDSSASSTSTTSERKGRYARSQDSYGSRSGRYEPAGRSERSSRRSRDRDRNRY